MTEAAASAREGLSGHRDAALEDMEAVLDAYGVSDPLLQPILDAARAVEPKRGTEEGKPEKWNTSIAWLLRQLRAHCLAGLGLGRRAVEMLQVAAALEGSSCSWVSSGAAWEMTWGRTARGHRRRAPRRCPPNG